MFLSNDIFRTKSVPVKLVVQIFVLFVVDIDERGEEESYFVPNQISDKAPTHKIYRCASREKRPRTRSCHESKRLG